MKTHIVSEESWEQCGALVEATPMRRFRETAEVAAAMCWLAGEKSGFVTGVALPVGGGFVA